MRTSFFSWRNLLLPAVLLAFVSGCAGGSMSVKENDGYATAVTAQPGSLLYYEQLAKTQSENADSHYDLAVRYSQVGDLKKAEASYRQALIIKPSHVPAAVNLSDLLRSRGNYEGAIQVLEELFGTGVDDPRARTNLASLYRMTGRLDESLRESIKLTKKYGVIYGAKLNVGLIYYDRGHYDMALTVLSDLLKDNPDDAVLRASMGQVYLKQDRILHAEREFQQAVSMDTKNFAAWNGLGLVALRKDENDRALEAFDKALEANVNYAQAHANRGIALRKLGRFTEAGEAYGSAIEINPTMIEAYYNRGVLFDDYAKNFTEAIVVWKDFRAQEQFPAEFTTEVDKRISRLEEWLVKHEEERARRLEREAALAEKAKEEARKKAEEEARLAAEAKAAAEAEAAALAAAAATAATNAATAGEAPPPPAAEAAADTTAPSAVAGDAAGKVNEASDAVSPDQQVSPQPAASETDTEKAAEPAGASAAAPAAEAQPQAEAAQDQPSGNQAAQDSAPEAETPAAAPAEPAEQAAPAAEQPAAQQTAAEPAPEPVGAEPPAQEQAPAGTSVEPVSESNSAESQAEPASQGEATPAVAEQPLQTAPAPVDDESQMSTNGAGASAPGEGAPGNETTPAEGPAEPPVADPSP